MKKYVDGIILLMKRGYSEAIGLFSQLIKKKQTIRNYLGNCFSFRAFAWASL